MIKLHSGGVFLTDGKLARSSPTPVSKARKNTIAYSILQAHNRSGSPDKLRLSFDALASHDITYVGIIQTARASGMTDFPVPYALTNCHNSLCAVGGTINEDDHVFGLSAARKYGGIYVPANLSVIHSYVREEMAKCGGMLIGSDSHTRYGALGMMGVGEGGPELVKQLLGRTYDIDYPEVVLVYLTGSPRRGTGPHDAAIALIKAVFASGFVKNRVLEFTGPGLGSLPVDFRNGIDVMTTETMCLSSIWETDDIIKKHYETHGRPGDFRRLAPGNVAYYDRCIEFDLSALEPMIALPYHPSNAYTIREFRENAADILRGIEVESEERLGVKIDLLSKQRDGEVYADQGIIAGCAGGMFDSICEASAILSRGKHTKSAAPNPYFSLSVYPTSVPVSLELTRAGVTTGLLSAGAVIKPAFCGPCFGAGDVPANNGLSIRHTTRNFPNREGSKPGEGQAAGVALMDARSIAATALCGGAITPADEIEYEAPEYEYHFDNSPYLRRVYYGFGKPQPETPLILGPNISEWPEQHELGEHLLLELAAVIHDDVTTTDELIPSGETSSYRSNPRRLAEFTLSRRVPDYVPRAKSAAALEIERRAGKKPEALMSVLGLVGDADTLIETTQFGSAIYATCPGDGSAREQAASCQKVLGGLANICVEYATKRYRSNCINWGIIPFRLAKGERFNYEPGDYVFVPNIRSLIASGETEYPAKVIRADRKVYDIKLIVDPLTENERQILLDGCLMNYYKNQNRETLGR
ncbi:MAG: hydratase [Eubacteriales bacterium]|jgi:aconitate hydratase